MTTSIRAASACNHFVDVLRGIVALLTNVSVHRARLLTMDRGFQSLSDVVLLEKII
mgnify:CR=1 FL=1